MKELFKNLKKVYKYGKDYKLNLLMECIGSLIGIAISIILPILSAKLIVYVTDNVWIQVLLVSFVILIVNIFSHLKTVLIRKNTQIFSKGIIEKLHKD